MMRRTHRGFSLLELLIVLAIIMALSAIAVPNLLRARQDAYEVSAVGFLHTLQTAQIAYRTSNGVYASTFSQLPEVWVNTSTTTTTTTTGGGQGQGQGNANGQGQGNAKGQGQGNANGQGQGNSQGQGNANGKATSGGSGNTTTTTTTTYVRSYYIFALTVASGEQWHCTAAPTLDRSGGRYFYTDETGVIRYEHGSTASATSPPVQ